MKKFLKSLITAALIAMPLAAQVPAGNRVAWADTIKIDRGGIFTNSRDMLYVDDTTTVDIVSGVNSVYVKSLSSTNANGGGWLSLRDSAFAEGVKAYPHPTPGMQWVRDQYLQTKTIDVYWAGAISGDATADHTAIQLAVNSLSDGDKLQIAAHDGGKFILNSSNTQQILFTDKDNIVVELRADMFMANGTINSVTLKSFFEFVDCDTLVFDGFGSKLDGNTSGQSGASFAGGGRGGIWAVTSSQDSLRDITIKNLEIFDVFGNAIWIEEVIKARVENCKIDTVGEGIVVKNATDVIISDNQIGYVDPQDGIEPSFATNFTIRGNVFTDSVSNSGTNTHLDIFESNYVYIYDNSNTGSDMRIDMNSSTATTVHHIYINNNNFQNLRFIELTGTNPRDVYIKENTLEFIGHASKGYFFLLKAELGSGVYSDWHIKNNLMILTDDGTSANTAIFHLQGRITGAHITGNTIINRTTTTTPKSIVFAAQSSTNPGGARIADNVFIDFPIGVDVGGSTIDSTWIIDNHFYGTQVDSVWFGNELRYNFDSDDDLIVKGDWPVDIQPNISDNMTLTVTDSIFTPLRSIHLYTHDTTARIDTINGAHMPYLSTIRIYQVSGSGRRFKNEKNIKLNGDWITGSGYDFLELLHIGDNVWLESSRLSP